MLRCRAYSCLRIPEPTSTSWTSSQVPSSVSCMLSILKRHREPSSRETPQPNAASQNSTAPFTHIAGSGSASSSGIGVGEWCSWSLEIEPCWASRTQHDFCDQFSSSPVFFACCDSLKLKNQGLLARLAVRDHPDSGFCSCRDS